MGVDIWTQEYLYGLIEAAFPDIATYLVPQWFKATGVLAFVMIGVGVTIMGHLFRAFFGRGGVIDASTEGASHFQEKPTGGGLERLRGIRIGKGGK